MTQLSAEQWHQVRSLFESLCEQDQTAWQSALQDVEPAVRQHTLGMLEAQQQSKLAVSAAAQAPGLAQLHTSERIGQRVGQFELVELLGAGGMGEVFRARRVSGDFEQTVAIKFLAIPVGRFQHRFDRERQLLAQLEHPNIARMIDGGTTDQGVPYLVMEYINGRQIEAYCQHHQLDAEQRVSLVMQVADAVSQAHSQLVIHRDIKPDNVLVTEHGQAKLMDFGIAALLDPAGNAQVTQLGLMTPTSAAPEQLRAERTTVATDIFQLGLLAFRLLSGRHAFAVDASASQDSSLSQLLESEATPLGRVLKRRGVPRLKDLEAILAKALKVEPTRRYRSCAALRDDLSAWRDGGSVAARHLTTWSAAWDWASRNRLLSAALTVAAASLVLGSAVALWQARAAKEQLAIALANEQQANQVADFLNGVFRSANTFESQGVEPTASELLASGVDLIDQDLADQPLLQARLLVTMGVTYRSRSEHETAGQLIRRAIELLNSNQASVDDRAQALAELAWVETYQENFDQAKQLLLEGLVLLAPAGRDHAPLRGQLLQRLIIVEINREDLVAASQAATEALGQFKQALPVDHQRIASVLNLQGTIARESGDWQGALAAYSESLPAKREAFGSEHHSVAITLGNIAAVQVQLGQYEQAIQLFRESIAINEKFFGDAGHIQLFVAWRGMAKAYRDLGDFDQATAAFQTALNILVNDRGENYSQTQQVRAELAELYWLLGQFNEAISAQSNAAQALARAEDPNWRCLGQGLVSAQLWFQRAIESRSRIDCVENLPVNSRWRARAIRALATPALRATWFETDLSGRASESPLFEAAVETTTRVARAEAAGH